MSWSGYQWQVKTAHSGNTSPKQPPQTTLPTLQAPGGTKMIHSFCSDLREHICCLNTQSSSRSPLKLLSESHEEEVVLEPVLRACLLPLAAPGAQGSQNGSQAIMGEWGSPEAVFGTPVQNNRLKPHCQLYKLQVAQKRYTRFVAI